MCEFWESLTFLLQRKLWVWFWRCRVSICSRLDCRFASSVKHLLANVNYTQDPALMWPLKCSVWARRDLMTAAATKCTNVWTAPLCVQLLFCPERFLFILHLEIWILQQLKSISIQKCTQVPSWQTVTFWFTVWQQQDEMTWDTFTHLG